MRDLLNLRPSKARTTRACELIGPGVMRNDGEFSETGSVKTPIFLLSFCLFFLFLFASMQYLFMRFDYSPLYRLFHSTVM